jgi:hypothetical protein
VELSRVVVLASRPVEGNTVSQLIDNQTLLRKVVHLDGQGRFTRVVAVDAKRAPGTKHTASRTKLASHAQRVTRRASHFFLKINKRQSS